MFSHYFGVISYLYTSFNNVFDVFLCSCFIWSFGKIQTYRTFSAIPKEQERQEKAQLDSKKNVKCCKNSVIFRSYEKYNYWMLVLALKTYAQILYFCSQSSIEKTITKIKMYCYKRKLSESSILA